MRFGRRTREVRSAEECSFLTDQKETEKVTASSDARGTAWGLHAPKTPKEEVESKKPGKMPRETIFPSVFPILHR